MPSHVDPTIQVCGGPNLSLRLGGSSNGFHISILQSSVMQSIPVSIVNSGFKGEGRKQKTNWSSMHPKMTTK